ncbi:MAG: hypothetical protein H6737_06455 [Alphaproteobacteria bacterium]|nr:hypothetical protein [Alphaproteobacteria bacterium]
MSTNPPDERVLTDDERDEIHEGAVAALEALGIEPDDPAALVHALERHVLARRMVRSDHDEEVFRMGALYAHLLEEVLGWEIVELVWPTITAMAVAPMDRSLAILPFLAVAGVFDRPGDPALLASTFDRLAAGERPPGLARGGYAVLLP